MLGTRETGWQDLVRFVALSGGGWLVDTILLLSIVRTTGAPPQVANLFSASCAAAIVYLVAHHAIHAGVPHRTGLRLALYLGYTLVIILAASAAMMPAAGLAALITGAAPASLAVIFAAKCLITPPQLLCNFLVSRALARATLGHRNGG